MLLFRLALSEASELWLRMYCRDWMRSSSSWISFCR